MTPFELASVIIAFIALVISILSFGYQTVNNVLTMGRVDKANAIAQRALDISMFSYTGDIIPNLVGKMYITEKDGDFSTFLIIQNMKRGKAIISNIKCIQNNVQLSHAGKAIVYPIELKLNNGFTISLYITDISSDDISVHGRPTIQYALNKSSYEIRYSDSIGTPYSLLLKFDSESNLFKGIAKEID